MNHNTATLLRNVNSGGVIVFSLIMVSMFTLLTEIITAVTIWLMLVMIDAFTVIIVAGFIGSLLYFIIKGFRKKITEQGRIQNEYSALYIKCINQSLGAIKETKVSCKEEFFLDAFRKAYFEYGKANGKFLFMNQLPRMLIETIIVCGLLLLIITKLLLGNQPAEIVPLLGVLALAAFRLMPSANRIVNLSNGIRFQMPFFNELYEDLLIIKNKGEKETETCLQKPESRMDFENVISVEELGFAYPEIEKQVLNNISFSIPKGKFVGIVGPSGAGKTTFVDILLGLLPPSKGKISVDWKNIYDDIRTWQANLAYVECMWLMLQHDTPEDFVIATGDQHTVRDFTEKAFKEVGINIRWEGTGINEKGYDVATGKMLVCVNEQWFRPTEVDNLWGDPTKAKKVLGWDPQKTSYEELIKIMVKHDYELAKREAAIKRVR